MARNVEMVVKQEDLAMIGEHDGDSAKDGRPGANGESTRPQQGGEAATTRFGMKDGDNTDVSTAGLNQDQQRGARDQTAPQAFAKSKPLETNEAEVEDEAAKLGDLA